METPYRVAFCQQREVIQALQLASLLFHAATFDEKGQTNEDRVAQCVAEIDGPGNFIATTIVNFRPNRGRLLGTIVTFMYSFSNGLDGKWFLFDAEVVARGDRYAIIEIPGSHRPTDDY